MVRFNHFARGGVNRHIVILIASAMHLSWAAALLFAPLHTTGIELVLDLSFGSHIIAAIFCAAVSLAAVAAIFCRNLTLCVFLVLPQQFLLIASAIGAVFCVVDGKFRPMTVRSNGSICDSCGHTVFPNDPVLNCPCPNV